MVDVLIERLPHGEGLSLPSYATSDSAGADLRAAVDGELVLAPMQREAIPTGFKLAIPKGFEGQVRPRSGLALRQGLTVANAPGTVDADYRGEVRVILVNLGAEAVTIRRGDRIAQLVIAPVTQVSFTPVGGVPSTDRGPGGFGSTGV